MIGVLLGGVFEVLLQVIPLKKRGFKFTENFRLVHPVARRIGRLLLPRMAGTAVYQVSVLIDTVLASFSWIVGAGGVAALYYANRLVHLPLAVFGISIATAALPRMSKEAALNNMGKLKKTIAFSLKVVFTVMVPAAVGLMILAEPIIKTLFQRGEFTAYSTGITSNALFFYSFGLLAYAGIKILVNAYYSMGDTRTPVKTAACSLVINIVLNVILMYPLKLGGLALATSVSATVNFLILYALLVVKIGDIGTARIVSSFIKTCAAAFIMGIGTFLMARVFLAGTEYSSYIMLMRLAAVVSVSGVIYLVTAYLIGLEGVKKLAKLVNSGW